jgi:hypothetical protein
MDVVNRGRRAAAISAAVRIAPKNASPRYMGGFAIWNSHVPVQEDHSGTGKDLTRAHHRVVVILGEDACLSCEHKQ